MKLGRHLFSDQGSLMWQSSLKKTCGRVTPLLLDVCPWKKLTAFVGLTIFLSKVTAFWAPEGCREVKWGDDINTGYRNQILHLIFISVLLNESGNFLEIQLTYYASEGTSQCLASINHCSINTNLLIRETEKTWQNLTTGFSQSNTLGLHWHKDSLQNVLQETQFEN